MFTTLTTEHYQQFLKFIMTLINVEVFEKEVLQLLRNIIKFDEGIFIRLKNDSFIDQIFGYQLDDGFIQEYMAKCHNIDPLIDYKNRSISESFADETKILDLSRSNSDKNYLQYKGFYSKYDINHCLMFSINDRGDGIRLYRKDEASGFTKQEYEICKYLASLIGDAYRHHLKDYEVKNNAKLYNMMKSNMYFGVLLLDNQFKLISYNKIGIERATIITNKTSLDEITTELTKIMKQMMENESKSNQSLTIYEIMDNYIIEMLVNRELNEFDNIITNYIVYIYGKAWFSSILNLSAEKVIEKYDLTDREKQLVTLILKGYSNLNISEELFISTYTVKEHIKSIFRKMNLKSRGELIIKVYSDRGQDINTVI
ncbi:MAG: helix-turn-helix transcriptional regulator [Peptostreptococcaceae bacterium]|nr:helix-turn-helix transcriptional regulator [Peptostreptococcaceae bacterium]